VTLGIQNPPSPAHSVAFAGEASVLGVDPSSTIARSALEHWRGSVRAALVTSPFEDGDAGLRRLAAWYERVCVDDEYAQPAPDEGVVALVKLLRRGGEPERNTLITHRAICVAQQLTSCRARARWGGDDRAGADGARRTGQGAGLSTSPPPSGM
jgi:hypothetical protein